MKPAKHLVKFMQKRCFPDFSQAMHHKLDPKEIVECWSMLEWVMYITDFQGRELIWDLGCGKRPTLATMAAFFMADNCDCIAVDPQLDTTCSQKVTGLTLTRQNLEYRSFSEDIKFLSDVSTEVLIMANHSHHDVKALQAFIRHNPQWQGTYVTRPCCVDNTIMGVRGLTMNSKAVHAWTPKSQLFAYKFGNGKFKNWDS